VCETIARNGFTAQLQPYSVSLLRSHPGYVYTDFPTQIRKKSPFLNSLLVINKP